MATAWIVWLIWGLVAMTWSGIQRTDAGTIGTMFIGVLPWMAAGVALILWTVARWIGVA